MRKIGMLAAALLVTMPGLANRTVSKTSRIDSPIFKIASPEQLTLSRSDRMDRKEDGYKGAFQVVGLYSRSLESDDLAAYFLPVDKSTLVTGEIGSSAYVSNLQNNQALDVCANYFNIFTNSFGGTPADTDFNTMTFQSNLTFKPKHTIAGVGLQWQQEFRKYYFKVDAPIVKVTHDLGMTENVINVGGGANQAGSVRTSATQGANMTAAFNQAGLLYGKIDGKRSKWGVADMEFVFGRNWMDTDVCQVSSYLGILAPTGGKPDPEYLDNAIVGNGGHWGFMMGSGSRFVWKETDNYTVSICWDVDSRYFLRNTQTRMLDLKNRPWSRYMWLAQYSTTVPGTVTNESLYEQGLDFAVNVLTQPVHVKSHGAFTANTAFNFRRDCGLEVEVGTNFYARQAEKINLLTPWINYNKWMLPAVGVDVNAAAWSASANFISINNAQLYGNDAYADGSEAAVPLTQDDIDLNSACQSAVVENTFYGSIGKNWDHWRYPSFAGIGGSYTYSGDNVGNKRFMLWAKLGTSF